MHEALGSSLDTMAMLSRDVFIGQNAYAQTLPDFTELVEDAAPGVVNISTSRTVQRSPAIQGFGGQEIPEIFRHFFGDSFPTPPGSSGEAVRSANR